MQILVGVVLGVLLGSLNLWALKASVRRALGFKNGARAVMFILFSYVLRYAVMGGVVFGLVRVQEHGVALVVLLILGGMTLLMAVGRKRMRKPEPGVGATAPAGGDLADKDMGGRA